MIDFRLNRALANINCLVLYALHIRRHLSENNLRLLAPPFFEPGVEVYNPHDMQSHVEEGKIGARDVQTPLQKIDEDSEEEENETENGQGKRDDEDQSSENHLDVHNSQETPSKVAPFERDHTFHTTPESRLGHILGESLELTEILRIGPYGVVYLAIDLLTTMAYAAKALSKYDASRRSLDMQQIRFQQREIQLHYIASAHPNVVSMHRIFDGPDCTYVILDYYPDGDLFDNITEKCRYVGDDASIRTAFLQIVGAVAHCHQLGIYHRDLKPENLLVNGSTLALNDFSLATTSVYSEDHGCGSTFYMSPECLAKPAEGAFYKCAPNDIWSLGVILINLICGRNPWKQASLEDPTYGAFTRNPNFLKSILPLSDEVNKILITIFEPDPDKRIMITELEAAIVRCSSFYNGSFEIHTQQESYSPTSFIPSIDDINSEAELHSCLNKEGEEEEQE